MTNSSLSYFDIMLARKAFLEGKNVTETLRNQKGLRENTPEVIETAYDLQAGSTAINRVITDLVKGNGRVFGYGTLTEKDGDLLYYSFDGKVTTVANASGKPATSSQGTWMSTGGTGKWQQRDARGSFKNAVVGPGTSLAEWEGNWETRK